MPSVQMGHSWTFEPVARLWYNAFPNHLLKRAVEF